MKLWKRSKPQTSLSWLSCKGLVPGVGKEFFSSQGCAALPRGCETQGNTGQELPWVPEEPTPDNTSQKGSNFLLMNNFLHLSFSTTNIFQNLPLMMIRIFLHSQFVLILHLPQLSALPSPWLMFTLIYFGSAIISPHSITFNRLKQWSFFCHPFIRQALHSLRCSCRLLCTCSSLSFSFLSLSDWDGTEKSRGGFASTFFFYLFHCHITPMAQLSHPYLNTSIFFSLDDHKWWAPEVQ